MYTVNTDTERRIFYMSVSKTFRFSNENQRLLELCLQGLKSEIKDSQLEQLVDVNQTTVISVALSLLHEDLLLKGFIKEEGQSKLH